MIIMIKTNLANLNFNLMTQIFLLVNKSSNNLIIQSRMICKSKTLNNINLSTTTQIFKIDKTLIMVSYNPSNLCNKYYITPPYNINILINSKNKLVLFVRMILIFKIPFILSDVVIKSILNVIINY